MRSGLYVVSGTARYTIGQVHSWEEHSSRLIELFRSGTTC